MANKKTLTDWDFRGVDTRRMTHCIHAYPAMMIPQIAERLIVNYGAKAKTMFDPYCGTGSSLLEANVRGIHAIGTDLNPLARLISKVKTTRLNCQRIESHIRDINRRLKGIDKYCKQYSPPLIKNLDFWFSPSVQQQLMAVRTEIETIKNVTERRFFNAAFSETVRESSYTRNSEFKLYRMPAEKMQKFHPDVFGIFSAKLVRNFAGMKQYVEEVKKSGNTNVFEFNTVYEMPPDCVAPESVDIVVTSPPYGDSKTTVAYGQFSRLANEWLAFENPSAVDGRLMGGKVQKNNNGKSLGCNKLDDAIGYIHENSPTRAAEISAFYEDYKQSIARVAAAVRSGGVVCYVVGNRKSKGVVLPTDEATKNYFIKNGFRHLATYTRNIPNKRMPSKNSPSNIPGACDSTIQQEYIIVMQKKL